MSSRNRETYIIKVCGVTSLEDVRIACEAGANAIGFNFYAKSPRYITASAAHDLAASLPAGVLRVGVFVNPSPDDLIDLTHKVPLDVVQIHGSEPAGTQGDANVESRVWKAVAVDPSFQSSILDELTAEAFLLDTPTKNFGGSGERFDWTRVTSGSKKIIIAGGLDGSNVGEAIGTMRPWGVDACSRLESAPGKKDSQKVREFVGNARAAFESLQKLEALN
jgi:phosphoribosylanthranilate isomerase